MKENLEKPFQVLNPAINIAKFQSKNTEKNVNTPNTQLQTVNIMQNNHIKPQILNIRWRLSFTYYFAISVY